MTSSIVSPDTPQLKRCSKCGELKPPSEFYHSARSSDGAQKWCKTCCSVYAKGWREKNAEALKDKSRQYRTENSAAIKERGRQYYAENAEVINARHRQKYRDNPEATRERDRKWKEANADEFKEYQRKYYAEHAESIRERNKIHYHENSEEIRARHRRYHKSTAGQSSYRVRKHRRRAREADAAGTFTGADIEAIRVAQGNRCYLCGKPLKKYHIDHFIPLAKGGTNDPGNLRLACPKCNLSKHDKHPFEMGRLL